MSTTTTFGPYLTPSQLELHYELVLATRLAMREELAERCFARRERQRRPRVVVVATPPITYHG